MDSVSLCAARDLNIIVRRNYTVIIDVVALNQPGHHPEVVEHEDGMAVGGIDPDLFLCVTQNPGELTEGIFPE